MNYAPIHNHSEYSALDGLSTCREIAERCKEIGVKSVGISDHGTVSGHLEFAKEMAKHDIKPIFGCELYHGVKTEFGKNERDQAHFLAGAVTDEGLRNLWRIVDAASENFRYVGRVNWDILKQHSEGLFATSACIQGLVAQEIVQGETDALNRYLEIFRENFYVEIHTYPGKDHEELNAALVSTARERGLPLIYATDAHFASPEQYEVHDAYVAMQTGETALIPKHKRKMWHPKSLYIQDEEQIRESLAYLPEDAVDEALSNSGELADRCSADLPEVKRHLPAFIPKRSPWVDEEDAASLDAGQLLLREVETGINERYGEKDTLDEAWDRAATEIEVFLDAGLEHYFLQAWDFVQYCEENGIRRGPGRGSAAGSIVAYALRITDIDPIKYDLIFERFYNPGRAKGFPDIDNDFPTKAREKVRKYLEDRWGQDKVRSIGTITRMKPKAAIERTHKVWGITYSDMEALKKVVDDVPDIDILGPDSIGWSAEVDPGKTIYVMDHVGPEIIKWVEGLKGTDNVKKEVYQDRALRWLDLLEMVCSRIEGYGLHPSGIVVSDVPLADELPCMWNANKKLQFTCFPMSDVEDRMFVKQDFLGLRNLDTLDEWESMVTEQEKVIKELHLEDVVVENPRTKRMEIDWEKAEDNHDSNLWKLFDDGLTLGLFQIEAGYARHLCKEFKPRSIDDLGIIVALNRPGPIRSGAPDSFITRRNGGTDDKFDGRKIPIIADITEPTLGWFLYQEQVIAYFSELGYNLSDADAVRKILGKKKPEDMRALYRGEGEWTDNGYMEMAKKAGLAEQVAQTIWDKLEDFAKYSFNKSHSIGYGTITFRTDFAKFYGTPEYYMSCIRTNPKKAGQYVGEARRMSIDVLPPNIQHSDATISKSEDGNIYFGFSDIKGLGVGSARYLCRLREKYVMESPEEVFAAIETEWGMWDAERDQAKQEGVPFKKPSPRQQFRKNLIPLMEQVGAFEDFEERDITLTERQALEKELLKVIISDNCDEIFNRNSNDVDSCDTYADLEMAPEDQKVHVPGIVSDIDPKKTKVGSKPMGVVTIEYHGDQADFVVFPKQWKSYKFLWKERTPAIFTLAKGDRGFRFEGATQLK